MPRVTRAKAAELAESLHIDEEDILAPPFETDAKHLELAATPEKVSRAPLGELAPNSAESKTAEGNTEGIEAKDKARKAGRKGKGSKKNDLTASTTSQSEVPEDEMATEDVASNGSQGRDETSQSPATEQESPLEDLVTEQPPSITIEETPFATTDMNDRPVSPIASATPKVIHSLRKDTPGKRSTSNKENVSPIVSTPTAMPSTMRLELPSTPYDTLETAAIGSATPPAVESASPSAARQSSPRAENPIEALDELDDAVDKVNQEIPEVMLSPEKKKKEVRSPVQARSTGKSKPAPVIRTTKASQARLSLALGTKTDTPKAPTLGRPRPSTTLGRSGSVRQSTAPAPAPAASKRVISTSNGRAAKPSDPAVEKREKKEVVIPHSKPRPISLSFPTPPPPQRSTKPTTKSSFQLPGEAVAAKLRAAREERMKNETSSTAAHSNPTTKPNEGTVERKPSFKARPAPNMLKKTPSVRTTAASRARESIMNGTAPPPAPVTSLKRSNTVPSSRPSPRPSTMPSEPNSLHVSKRPATRPSIAAASNAATTNRITSTSSTGAARTTTKGREVFNRAANAKADAEKEKREKEEAAKKARAQAAERGRQASREWAEKQKAKKMVAKSATLAVAV